MLHVHRQGHGPELVLLHGFTQSWSSWAHLVGKLPGGRSVVLPDLPGHGLSHEVSVDLCLGADMLAGQVREPAGWVGYSMGGRFALHVALRHPDVVSKLVLISTTAGIDDPAERELRRASDERLAATAEQVGLSEFVRRWLELPLFSTLRPGSAALESRSGGSAEGLASSLRLAGTGSQEPLWDRLADLEMPTLVIAGTLDAKYVALAQRLVEAIGDNASLVVLEGVGHSCHLEDPDSVATLIAGFA